eukprot:2773283-Rhodomonas_salina.1
MLESESSKIMCQLDARSTGACHVQLLLLGQVRLLCLLRGLQCSRLLPELLHLLGQKVLGNPVGVPARRSNGVQGGEKAAPRQQQQGSELTSPRPQWNPCS